MIASEISNGKKEVYKEVLIKQLTSLNLKTEEMLNEVILEDFNSIDLQSFINTLMIYKDFLECVNHTARESI